jgi:hypothetical protein
MCRNVLPQAFLCDSTEVCMSKNMPTWKFARQVLEDGRIFARPNHVKQYTEPFYVRRGHSGVRLIKHTMCTSVSNATSVCLTTGKLERSASSLAVLHLQGSRKGQMQDLYACAQQMLCSLRNR